MTEAKFYRLDEQLKPVFSEQQDRQKAILETFLTENGFDLSRTIEVSGKFDFSKYILFEQGESG